jgi:hypothetical protein
MAQRAASPYLQTLNLRPARVTEPWLVATLVLLDMVAVWAGLALAHTIGFRTPLAEIEALPRRITISTTFLRRCSRRPGCWYWP